MRLCPGGDVFGVRLFMPGVMISEIGSVKSGTVTAKPAVDAGLAPLDLITHVDGKPIFHARSVTDIIEASEGRPISFTVKRGAQVLTLNVTPVRSEKDGRYRIGVFLRDRTAGIGTVTFVDPQSGLFGGLGHGICTPENGELMPLARGVVTDVHIIGVRNGTAGTPGEIRGTLGASKRGAITKNSVAGVFGVLTDRTAFNENDALPLARKSEVKVGRAEIYSTLADGRRQRYEIEITKIHSSSRETKCFSIRVTDKALLEATGGIVQGMSGSPIIQNGKLVGAVTHVLINDPTAGYGIFIENMLNAAQMPMQKAA